MQVRGEEAIVLRLDRAQIHAKPRHAAQPLNLLDQFPGPVHQVVGEPFNVIRAAPRVDQMRNAGLLLQVDLGVSGNPGGEISWQGDGFIERIGVQRLGMT